MSQGRGWSLGEEISIEYIHQTSKEGGESPLLICKPMGSSLAKEVGYFVKSENLDIVTITNEDTSLITTSLQGDNSSVGPAKIEKDIKKIGIRKLVEGKITNAPPLPFLQFTIFSLSPSFTHSFPGDIIALRLTDQKLFASLFLVFPSLL